MAMIIRQAIADDALAIGAIYNHYIENTVATFQLAPHSDTYWQDWFTQFAGSGPHQCFVAEENGQVLGFAYSLPYNTKGGYDQTVLTSIYVDAEILEKAPRPGLGSGLYEALFNAIVSIHRIYAWIALPNEASINLHHKFGFEQVSTLSEIGFKHGRYIDVAVMERPG